MASACDLERLLLFSLLRAYRMDSLQQIQEVYAVETSRCAHFQKNVNLRKINEVDHVEKDRNNCCSLFGETSGSAVWPMPFPQITSNSSVLGSRPFAFTVTLIFPGVSLPRTTANALP